MIAKYLVRKPHLFGDEPHIRMDHLAEVLGLSSTQRVHDQVGRYWDYIGVVMEAGHLWIEESGIPIVARSIDTPEARTIVSEEDDERALMDALCVVGDHIMKFREAGGGANPALASLDLVHELRIELLKVDRKKVGLMLAALEALEEILDKAVYKMEPRE